MSAHNATGADAQNDSVELPDHWTRTDTSEVARFERDDGAVIRVRTDLPTRDAATFNGGLALDNATGTVRVLYHPNGVPGDSREIHSGGTEADGVEAAIAFIDDRCPEHDRDLTTDAAGCLHCPACQEAER